MSFHSQIEQRNRRTKGKKEERRKNEQEQLKHIDRWKSRGGSVGRNRRSGSSRGERKMEKVISLLAPVIAGRPMDDLRRDLQTEATRPFDHLVARVHMHLFHRLVSPLRFRLPIDWCQYEIHADGQSWYRETEHNWNGTATVAAPNFTPRT